MAFKSLKEFINVLEKNNELIRIKHPVNPELEITEITDRVSKAQIKTKHCYSKIQTAIFL